MGEVLRVETVARLVVALWLVAVVVIVDSCIPPFPAAHSGGPQKVRAKFIDAIVNRQIYGYLKVHPKSFRNESMARALRGGQRQVVGLAQSMTRPTCIHPSCAMPCSCFDGRM